jgi:hypothetical protein
MTKLIYLDILYPEFWLSDAIYSVFGINLEENINDDNPVNLQFNEFGFESKLFIKNSGSSFVFLIFYSMAWFLFIILLIFSKFSDL